MAAERLVNVLGNGMKVVCKVRASIRAERALHELATNDAVLAVSPYGAVPHQGKVPISRGP
jgi:hypothetical protein